MLISNNDKRKITKLLYTTLNSKSNIQRANLARRKKHEESRETINWDLQVQYHINVFIGVFYPDLNSFINK